MSIALLLPWEHIDAQFRRQDDVGFSDIDRLWVSAAVEEQVRNHYRQPVVRFRMGHANVRPPDLAAHRDEKEPDDEDFLFGVPVALAVEAALFLKEVPSPTMQRQGPAALPLSNWRQLRHSARGCDVFKAQVSVVLGTSAAGSVERSP